MRGGRAQEGGLFSLSLGGSPQRRFLIFERFYERFNVVFYAFRTRFQSRFLLEKIFLGARETEC